jgi:hypothetical protein
MKIWWFIAITHLSFGSTAGNGGYTQTTLGPFQDQIQCEQYRKEVMSDRVRTTSCWQTSR